MHAYNTVYIITSVQSILNTGLVDVPVRNLNELAPSRLLRKVDDVFVEPKALPKRRPQWTRCSSSSGSMQRYSKERGFSAPALRHISI